VNTAIPSQNSIINPKVTELDFEKISKELDALQINPVNGWETAYPSLFNWLNNLIKELSSKMDCKAPNLVLNFNYIQRQQASAQIMLDGSTQIHIGSELIKKFVLQNRTYKSYNAFRWTIAHELGHLIDPAFTRYGASYKINKFINYCVLFVLYGSIAHVFFPTFSAFPAAYCITGTISFMLLKKIFIIILHRQFEYNADKYSFKLNEFSIEDVKYSLTGMTDAIKQEMHEHSIANQRASWLNNRISYITTFYLHPKISTRILKLSKMQKK